MAILPIIDTNVVINGLRSRNSPESHILDAMVHSNIVFMACRSLMEEYEWALTSSRLLSKNHIPKRKAIDVLDALFRNVTASAPFNVRKTTPKCPDPGDQFLWDLLYERSNLILVTSDKHLQYDAIMRHRVVSPFTFVSTHHSLQRDDRYVRIESQNQTLKKRPLILAHLIKNSSHGSAAHKTPSVEVDMDAIICQLRNCQRHIHGALNEEPIHELSNTNWAEADH